jgi:AcrR family transcriptional regulator
MSKAGKDEQVGETGPGVREQLIAAAATHFSAYGYAKTTLADLARAIGFSKTYFYRFFKSKQEIGEAICNQALGSILLAVEREIAAAPTAPRKLRAMLKVIPEMGSNLFFQDRKLFDIAEVSAAENWSSSRDYCGRLEVLVQDILREGRLAGDFERKTPLDETVRAILQAMQPFIDPRMLQHSLDLVPDGSNEVIAMILRSLAP